MFLVSLCGSVCACMSGFGRRDSPQSAPSPPHLLLHRSYVVPSPEELRKAAAAERRRKEDKVGGAGWGGWD